MSGRGARLILQCSPQRIVGVFPDVKAAALTDTRTMRERLWHGVNVREHLARARA